jgi:hypothetical protein
MHDAGRLLKRAVQDTIKTTAKAVEAVCVTVLCVFVSLPELLIVIPVLILFPVVTFYLSEYFIFFYFIYFTILFAFLNGVIFFWDLFAPIACPILFAAWNLFAGFVAAALNTIYHFACPNGLHGDINKDCAPLMSLVNALISAVRDTMALLTKVATAISDVAHMIQQAICQQDNGVATCSGSSSSTTSWGSLVHRHDVTHMQRLAMALTGNSDNSPWGIMISVLHDMGMLLAGLVPTILVCFSALLDIAWINIQLFAALVSGIFHAVLSLFSGAMDQINKNNPNYPDKNTQHTAYENYVYNAIINVQFNSSNSFLARTPGPPGIKGILMRLVQLYSQIIYIGFNVVMSALMVIDKTICYIINPGGCVIDDACQVIFGEILKIRFGACPSVFPFCIDVSGVILNFCNWLTGGYPCICDTCPLKKDSLVYTFLNKHVPCNPQVATKSGICCATKASLLGLLMKLFGGV